MNNGLDDPGITLRHAAMTAGFAGLIMGLAAPFAEFFRHPKLFGPGTIDRAAEHIMANQD